LAFRQSPRPVTLWVLLGLVGTLAKILRYETPIQMVAQSPVPPLRSQVPVDFGDFQRL